MRFGIFLAPFHPVGQNPTLALQRDLDLVVHLDRLGFHEAWIGEHHSAGYEIIASPEVFIATAAERTRHIRFGTGVSSLPYHQPLMLADRMVLLDHLTRGRVMLGVGPGALPSDAFMMGIDVAKQRDMMEEALEAILLLLRRDEPVTYETDWFTLRDARLQLRPYQQPHFEVAVAAQVSPSGPRCAGRFGCSLLSIGATSMGGFDALSFHWGVMEERAEEFGTTVDRSDWRLVGPMHIADTKEQAVKDVEFGLAHWVDYFRRVAALPLAPEGDDSAGLAEVLNNTGFAVIGTPEDAIAQISRLQEQSKGFGTFLVMAQEWADREATLRSYELFAREVMPHFQGTAETLTASRDWAAENRPQFIGAAGAAIMSSFQRHNEEKEKRQSTERTVSLNGIDVHLHEAGAEGDPLVLLCHGFPELGYSWRHQLPALAEAGYRAVAPDQRGYGGTSRPAAIEDYDIVHLTDDLLALLDLLGEEQAVVVGHDWGSMVLSHLVLRAPERVRAAVWMSVPFIPRAPAAPTAIMKQLFTDTWFYMLYFQEPGVADADLGADPRTTMRRFLHTASAEAPIAQLTGLVSARDGRGFVDRLVDPEGPSAWLSPEELDVYVAAFERSGFSGGINWYRNLDRNWAITEAQDGARVTMPAAFVGGQADPVLLMSPPDGMKAWCDDFHGITLVEGAGHWVQQEKPIEVNQALLGFLRELD